MQCSDVHVCQEHRLYFSARVPVQSPICANQWRTLTRILSLSSMWSTPAVDGIRTHNLWIDNLCLTTRTPPLLANLKGLNFRPRNHSGFSNYLKIIFSYQQLLHFQIPHVYTKLFACKATLQQLLSWKSMRKSWSNVFCKQRMMITFTAWWSLHYINAFWRTFTVYIQRMIDR